MIAKLGPLVMAAAGSIGGTTFQRSANGLIVKVKPLPTYRNSSPSQTARQRINTLNRDWLAMDANDVKDWETFALTQVFTNRFGDVVPSTAYKAYMRCNSGSYMSAAGDSNAAPQLTAPLVLKGTLPALPRFQLVTATGVLRLNSSDATTDADTDLVLFAEAPRRPRHRTDKPRVQDGKFIALPAPGTALPYTFTAAYLAVFGRIPNDTIGENAWLRVQALDSTTRYPALEVILPLEYV